MPRSKKIAARSARKQSKSVFSFKKFLVFGLLLPLAAAASLLFFAKHQAVETGAAQTYRQAASGWAKMDNLVRAEFPYDPEAGNLLIAVLGSWPGWPIEPPAGWLAAGNESQAAPGLSIFYKLAAPGESRLLEISRSGDRANLALQIFEYQDIDANVSFESFAASTGQGQTARTGSVSALSDSSLIFAAFAVQSREYFSQDLTGGLALRQVSQTKGRGSLTLAAGDLTASAPGDFSSSAALSGALKWHGQIAVFPRRPAPLVKALQDKNADLSVGLQVSDEAPEPGEEVIYSVSASNAGAEELTGVMVKVALPTAVSLNEAGWSQGRFRPAAGIWEIGNLLPGQSASLNLRAFVNFETHDTAHIAKVSLLRLEQLDRVLENNEAYAAIDIPRVRGLRRDCPEIKNFTFELAGGAHETQTPEIKISANAAGASYVLLGQTPDRFQAVLYPLLPNLDFALSPQPGLKTVYAWFANFCANSPIMHQEIILLPSAPSNPDTADAPTSISDISLPAEDGFLSEPLPAADSRAEISAPTSADSLPAKDQEPASEVSVSVSARVLIPCLAPTAFTRALAPSEISRDVGRLQDLLRCLGYFPAELESTMIFGSITEQALMNFQADHGLPGVGRVGPSTLKVLNQFVQ